MNDNLSESEEYAPEPRAGMQRTSTSKVEHLATVQQTSLDDAKEFEPEPRVGMKRAPVPLVTSPTIISPSPATDASASARRAIPADEYVQQSGTAQPVYRAADFREFTDGETSQLLARQQQRAEQPAPNGETVPPSFARLNNLPLVKSATHVVWLLAIIIGLISMASITTAVRSVLDLPIWLQIPVWCILAILCMIGIVIAWRLLSDYRRLRVNVRLRGLDVVMNANHLIRQDARHQRLTEVRTLLMPFVESLPLKDQAHRSRLLSLGATVQQIDAMVEEQNRLLRGARAGDATWIEDFQSRLLKPLDDLAQRRLKTAHDQVFLITGVSQRGWLDSLFLLSQAFGIMHSLCVIYNVRASRLDEARLLYQLGASLVASTAAEQVLDAAGGAISERLGGLQTTASNPLAKFIGKAATSFADGKLNAWLIDQLGKAAWQALRPLEMAEPQAKP